MIELPKPIRPRIAPSEVYIRFGRWSGRSKNFATGEYEKGVSVYPARLIDGIVYLSDEMEVCRAVIGRLAFSVTGRLIGSGSDGEPVLKQVKALPYPIAQGSMPCFLSNGDTD
ncbi:MAG TPA: hypothetical protein VFR24_00140 [Candidatus Angelobacter sp.]|nr:hypothetical protein [Candidatus Angelobacter sp.]